MLIVTIRWIPKVIDNLIIRIDKGKQGKESFIVIDLVSEGEQIINDVKRDSEHVSNFNSLRDFIDEKFYTTLINKIIGGKVSFKWLAKS